MRLEGKIAIVTGGSSGLGRAVALGLAGEGVNVVVVVARNREPLEEVAEAIVEKGVRSLAITADCGDSAQVQGMVDQVVREFGALDILVNSAGVMVRGLVVDTSDEDWDHVVNTNLRSVFLCCRTAVRQMIPRRSGKIINMASKAGMAGAAENASYGATKAAIINFTRSLAYEVAPYNINVNAVAAGPTLTPHYTRVRSQEEIERDMKRGTLGQPEDMVSTVIFLCGDAGRMITGQTIVRDIFLGRPKESTYAFPYSY